MKKIKLTRGMFALVDDYDYKKLINFSWYAVPCHGSCYAARCGFLNGKKKTIYMHRHILGTIESRFVTDHIDRNGLNNQRSNIRICTQAENLRNQVKKKGNNPYKGVFKIRNKWQSYIQVNKNNIRLGMFDSPEMAAEKYNESAKKYHGEFAKLNEISKSS